MRFPACSLVAIVLSTASLPAHASGWYPIDSGRFWVYSSPDGASYSATVEATESFAGSLVQPLQWDPGNRELFSQDGAGRVLQHGLTGAPDGSYVVFAPPFVRMESQLTPGQQWEANHDVILYSADGVEMQRGWGRMTFSVVGVETVAVPAGTFQAAHVLITRENYNLAPYTFREWYADGVGLIRRTEEDGTTVLFELESYGPAAVPTGATTWGAIKAQFGD